MFDDVLIESSRAHDKKGPKKAISLPVSVALHALVLGAMTGASIWFVEDVPEPPIPVTFYAAAPPPPVAPPFTTETIEELKNFRLTIETGMGNIVIDPLPEKAPNHVRHILRLASLGAFDQTSVHRVAPRFVIQLGDLNTRKEPLTQKTNEFVVPIRAELNDVKHERGIVSMARGNEIDSALTSFFIVLGPNPGLDGTYTVFGRVVEGMDVIGKIEAVPVQGEMPTTRVDVYSMRVTRRN